MGKQFRGPLHEPGGKRESSGPFWDQASFFPKCHWMDEAAGAKQPPSLAMSGAAQASGWDEAGWWGRR